MQANAYNSAAYSNRIPAVRTCRRTVCRRSDCCTRNPVCPPLICTGDFAPIAKVTPCRGLVCTKTECCRPLDRCVAAQTLYMSPTGGFNNDCSSPAQACRFLRQAIGAADDMFKRIGGNIDVTIRVAPGTYKPRKSSVWTHQLSADVTFSGTSGFRAGSRLFITSSGACGEPKPVFDGDGSQMYFLTVTAADLGVRVNTNVHVSNLAFNNYATAINFMYGADSNSVRNCDFDQIGERYSKLDEAYRVIGILQSSNNLVQGNTFTRSYNRDCRTDLGPDAPFGGSGACVSSATNLNHPIYMLYHASNNFISGNSFIEFTGDAVRIRDFSNFNVMSDNVFATDYRQAIPSPLSAASEWYCVGANGNRDSLPNSKCKVTQPFQGIGDRSYGFVEERNVMLNGLLPYDDVHWPRSGLPTCVGAGTCRRMPVGHKFSRWTVSQPVSRKSRNVCFLINRSAMHCPSLSWLRRLEFVPDFGTDRSGHANSAACRRRAVAVAAACKAADPAGRTYRVSASTNNINTAVKPLCVRSCTYKRSAPVFAGLAVGGGGVPTTTTTGIKIIDGPAPSGSDFGSGGDTADAGSGTDDNSVEFRPAGAAPSMASADDSEDALIDAFPTADDDDDAVDSSGANNSGANKW